MECRGLVAVPDPLEDRLTLWNSTQIPHASAVDDALAEFGVKVDRLPLSPVDELRWIP